MSARGVRTLSSKLLPVVALLIPLACALSTQAELEKELSSLIGNLVYVEQTRKYRVFFVVETNTEGKVLAVVENKNTERLLGELANRFCESERGGPFPQCQISDEFRVVFYGHEIAQNERWREFLIGPRFEVHAASFVDRRMGTPVLVLTDHEPGILKRLNEVQWTEILLSVGREGVDTVF